MSSQEDEDLGLRCYRSPPRTSVASLWTGLGGMRRGGSPSGLKLGVAGRVCPCPVS